ncbi:MULTISPECIES: translation initiation factor 2 [Methylobacterium]|uniref:Translation initiation factor 2 n=5 Tax=Pseudomonadota TaxID=1224 RepID=A0ABQ4T2Q4_9HYPH|nr:MULTISPECIES: translation initiation factor 2 [Methylobacterium]GBU19398.1 hypothetical protein AwMethylo_36130 [Methylobacterium sp.]GJE08468.1 hypothetical protein AOPFMNJM_3805 [Methylobacterium jeotgali]
MTAPPRDADRKGQDKDGSGKGSGPGKPSNQNTQPGGSRNASAGSQAAAGAASSAPSAGAGSPKAAAPNVQNSASSAASASAAGPKTATAATSNAGGKPSYPGATGRGMPPGASPSEKLGIGPTKSGAASASAARTSEAKPGAKPDAPRSGFAGSTPAGSARGDDGPIIDLRAKRVPDAPTAKSEDGKAHAASHAAETPPETPVAATAEAAPVRSGAGFGSVAAAALLGGVLGAGLLYGLEQARGPGEDPRLAQVEQRLGAIDKRVAANESALKPLPEAVRAAEASAKQALARAGNESGGGAPAALPSDLAARLDSLDQRVSALQEEPGREQPANAPVTAVQSGAVAALEDRLKALESAPRPSPEVADLPARLAALQGETDRAAKADEALGQRLDALQQSLDSRVKAATESVQAATAAARQAADAGKAEAQEAARAADRRIEEQGTRLAALDKAVSQRPDAASLRAALRVVAADRIGVALRAGLPYADSLTALRGLGDADAGRLDALAPFATSGAPTSAALAAEFRPIAERIANRRKAEQARTVAETGDITQRLYSMAESIVQIRKVDAPATESGSEPDPAARVQSALDRGALAEAATAFDALPEAARTEAAAFGARLKARAAAASAAAGLSADAFKAIGAPAEAGR